MFTSVKWTVFGIINKDIFKLAAWLVLSKFYKIGKIPANLNYHMSIKKSQSILKCFIDLESSVWFTLGSEDETMFCDT